MEERFITERLVVDLIYCRLLEHEINYDTLYIK
jgi:hypothetical protein